MKPIPLLELFLRHVNKTGSCWLWTGGKDRDGYGLSSKGNGKSGSVRAHRRSWELLRGPIPEGKMILHRCDNPPCVNPDHLFVGTGSDNMKDAHAKGRHLSPTQSKPESQVRGERQHLAKLKESDIPKIFALREGGLKHYEIAAFFGVTKHTIQSVLAGDTWRHVKPAAGTLSR